MKLKQLFTDDDAVSPVIGVILMVAITVILAAVIGTFVLGLGDQVSDSAPQASFTFDYAEDGGNGNCGDALTTGGTEGTLDVTHDGGDKINENRLTVSDDDGGELTNLDACASITDGQDITAGTTFSPDVNNNVVVRVIWTASGGGDSATIGKWTGPAA